MLLIKNGHVIDPASGLDCIIDILIENGKFAEIAQDIPESTVMGRKTAVTEAVGALPDNEPLKIIDAGGLIVLPGLVDTHSHFRDPGFPLKEDIGSGAAAAAKGGYTSIVMMANTKPPVDNVGVLRDVLEKGRRTPVHIYSCANVTRGMEGSELTCFEDLKYAGAVGFTDDGKPIMNAALLRSAFEKAAELYVPVSLHEEDPSFVHGAGVNAGSAAARALGIKGADRQAEISMVKRDLDIALNTGANVVIQHISAAESVDLVRKAKLQAGGSDRIHAEASPHHFSLTEDAVLRFGTNAKCNPPLRTEADRQAIIEGLADGTIDIIATDHAPHTAEEKAKPFMEAPSGMTGLETAFSLGLKELVNTKKLALIDFVRLMTQSPADLYLLPAGRITVGAAADLAIIDAEATWTVGPGFASRSSNSPFVAETLPGVIRYTIAGGKAIFIST